MNMKTFDRCLLALGIFAAFFTSYLHSRNNFTNGADFQEGQIKDLQAVVEKIIVQQGKILDHQIDLYERTNTLARDVQFTQREMWMRMTPTTMGSSNASVTFSGGTFTSIDFPKLSTTAPTTRNIDSGPLYHE